MPLDLDEEDPLAFDASTAIPGHLPAVAPDPRDLTPEGWANLAEELKAEKGTAAAVEFLKELKTLGALTWEKAIYVSPLLRGMVFPEAVEDRATAHPPKPTPEPLRRCTICLLERAVSCFHKTGRGRRRGECEDCATLVKALWAKGHPPDVARQMAAQIRVLGTTPDLPGLLVPPASPYHCICPRCGRPSSSETPGGAPRFCVFCLEETAPGPGSPVDLDACLRGFAVLCRSVGRALLTYAEDLERVRVPSSPETGTVQESNDA